jgi:hypothetical protein
MQGEGGVAGSQTETQVSANEYSCAHHVTWSPNKLWRSTSIFTIICLVPMSTSMITLDLAVVKVKEQKPPSHK